MPTIEQNSSRWEQIYEWSQDGAEWSSAWGGPESQWFGAIFPRIHSFLPAETILEIAPGFGRWTQFLVHHCKRLVLVDLSVRCIEKCKRKFARWPHIEYHVNDGRSLDFIPSESIDFVFSFDSLVHAEADVIRDYIGQLATKLKANGVGFIHHSNLASYTDPASKEVPSGFENTHWRATSVSTEVFNEYCEAAGLHCVSQEKVNWGSQELIDAFSTFTPKRSTRRRSNRILENSRFMDEADLIARLSRLYSVGGWTD